MSNNFINIRNLDTSIVIDLRYSTIDNFTKQIIYHFNSAILRESTAIKLVKANNILREQGYLLKIWDAYRPLSAQQILWDNYPNEDFVAKPDPTRIRGHQLGATVDITLCTLDGEELEMQSAFDDFSEKAGRNHPRNKLIETRYQIMNQAMHTAGFIGYDKEWWHYSDINQDFPPEQVEPNNY